MNGSECGRSFAEAEIVQAFVNTLSRNTTKCDLSDGESFERFVPGGLFLLQYWAAVILLIWRSDPWDHQNYWGADVGTYLLLAVLVVATPACVYTAWRYRPG